MVGVAKGACGRNVNWDACSKYVGGAERARWETLLEMESLDVEVGCQNSIGATTLVVDLAKALEKVGSTQCGLEMGHVF